MDASDKKARVIDRHQDHNQSPETIEGGEATGCDRPCHAAIIEPPDARLTRSLLSSRFSAVPLPSGCCGCAIASRSSATSARLEAERDAAERVGRRTARGARREPRRSSATRSRRCRDRRSAKTARISSTTPASSCSPSARRLTRVQTQLAEVDKAREGSYPRSHARSSVRSRRHRNSSVPPPKASRGRCDRRTCEASGAKFSCGASSSWPACSGSATSWRRKAAPTATAPARRRTSSSSCRARRTSSSTRRCRSRRISRRPTREARRSGRICSPRTRARCASTCARWAPRNTGSSSSRRRSSS